MVVRGLAYVNTIDELSLRHAIEVIDTLREHTELWQFSAAHTHPLSLVELPARNDL